MAEFIAHEVEVSVSGRAYGGKPYHLVKRNSPVHDETLRILVHRSVHLLIHQPEYQCLVPDKSLVVTLCVADGFLILALVGQLPPDLAHAPLLVALFLQPFDPVVGDTHCHPEVEAQSAGLVWSRKPGHSAHVLGNGDGIRVYFLDQHRRKRQIGDGILVHAGIEIIVIAAEILAEAVVPVKHAGDPVETESVQMIFLHPELAVGKEEVLGLVLSIVEASRSPGRMPALRALVEIEVFLSVETPKALSLIVHAVGMHYVHNHRYAPGMGVVHEMLEFLRSAEAGGQRIEIGYLISERPVVRMLLECHYLQCVVSQLLHPRENTGPELLECGHLLLLGTHPYVAFIYERMGSRTGRRILPDVRFRRFPDLCAEHLGLRVLDHPSHIGRETFSTPARPLDEELVQIPVAEEHVRKAEFPVASAGGLQLVGGGPLPVVEFADEIDSAGIRSPFPENPAATGIPVQTVVKMVVQSGGEASAHRNLLAAGLDSFVSLQNLLLEREQIRVRIENVLLLRLCIVLLHNPSFFNHPVSRPCPSPCADKPCIRQ